MSDLHFTILPPDDLIESTFLDLSELARKAGDLAGMKATDKAALQFERGVRPTLSAETWLIESRTDASSVYRVRKEGGVWGCNCTAGLNGKHCWHVAYIAVIEAAWDRYGETDDGADDPSGPIVVTTEGDGLRLSRGDVALDCREASEVARAIDTLTGNASMGQRIAAARARLAA